MLMTQLPLEEWGLTSSRSGNLRREFILGLRTAQQTPSSSAILCDSSQSPTADGGRSAQESATIGGIIWINEND